MSAAIRRISNGIGAAAILVLALSGCSSSSNAGGGGGSGGRGGMGGRGGAPRAAALAQERLAPVLRLVPAGVPLV